MEDKITIVHVEEWEFYSQQLKEIIDSDPSLELVGQYVEGQPAILGCVKTQPDIIIIAPDIIDMTWYEFVKAIQQSCPTTQIIMSAINQSPDLIRESLLAGIRYFLPLPFNKQQTIDIIKTVAQIKRIDSDLLKD
jgi:DNA-binding NarL/FixJ family response regulator